MKTFSFLIVVVLFTLLSCTKVDLDQISNLNNGKIDVIGHAGSGFQSLINPYPGNSFKSVKHAVDGLNADGIEIDIETSKDTVLMLYHDQTLEKSTNCYGCVNQLTSSDLENCEYYNQYGAQVLSDVRIEKLSTVLSHFSGRFLKPKIYLNLKIATPCIADGPDQKGLWVNKVSGIIQEFQAYDWIYVYDGDTSLLENFRKKDSRIRIIYNAQSYDEAIHICSSAHISSMVISNDDISKEQVMDAHSKNIQVIIWGIVRRKDVVEAIKKSPDALMTDNIPLTQQCLKD